MAERIESRASQNNTSEDTYLPPPKLRRLICGFAQLLALPFILSMVTAPWLGVFAFYRIIAEQKTPSLFELLLLGMMYVAINVTTIGIVIGSKWVILGRTKPGVIRFGAFIISVGGSCSVSQLASLTIGFRARR
jgi:hypothetical protein